MALCCVVISHIFLMKLNSSMMQRLLLILISFAILSSGCSEEFLLERKEDKLIGAWEFEKVTYKEYGRLFAENVTVDYHNDIIEFYDDYSAIYDDFSLSTIYPGDWLIRLDRDNTSDGSSTEYFVDVLFYGMMQGEDFGIFGSIDRLGKHKLHLEAYDSRGEYTFKLRRL
jgi:hypothetical protein